MDNYIPSFTDISEWGKKPYSNTGGTRAKNIYINRENDTEFFFKGSKRLDDGTFKYPTEFWSEIIASKIGEWLGFNILDYNIGYDINDEQQIGCLSKSMVVHTENKLSEGVEYLRGYDPGYIPEFHEYKYTFNFIRETLTSFELKAKEKDFVEMLFFDSIIGNSDRHQENWGFISNFKETIEEINSELRVHKGVFGRIGLRILKFAAKGIQEISSDKEEDNSFNIKQKLLKRQSSIINTCFSPIYDSGCCLGRELTDEKIIKMLEDKMMLESYVLRGKAEVRWAEGKLKPKHFDLLKMLKPEFTQLCEELQKRVSENFSEEKLRLLIFNIDKNLPKELSHFKLSTIRKELIMKLIPLRVVKLMEI
ncbi:hypothetical protein [Maribacter dokdonensis]|uniref:hypothetical protein n=1 Tax=Maribacter dokdonensis TaxID=320912 RepID=UPI002732A401|nr:hypothetical protein [Maribacter dokdonensis]MDP2527553.1 hypothetical protein [Maribacter dokdonensis]